MIDELEKARAARDTKLIIKMLDEHDELWQKILKGCPEEQDRISWAATSIFQAVHGLISVHGDYGRAIIWEAIDLGMKAAKE
jgi:hypothetical protein